MKSAERTIGLPRGIDIGYENIYDVTSVGIFIHSKDMRYMVLVQQNDQPGRPWAIPAGKVDDELDQNPQDTAAREALEEVGIQIDQSRLKLISANSPIGKPLVAQPIYAYEISLSEIDLEFSNKEISRVRIVNTKKFFGEYCKDGRSLYRQEKWWATIKSLLESKYII